MLEVFVSEGRSPALDLAFESWLLERAADGKCCLGVWSWPAPVVVIGHGQDPQDVDLGWCRDQGIPVLRRITGGTGVIHSGDLAVSLALPKSHAWARGVVSLYSVFLDALEPALRAVGGDVSRPAEVRRATRVRSPICFEDLLSDTLLVGERKAVGCAQARRKDAVLIHAVILLGLDAALYERVFQVPERRVRRHLAPAVPGGDWRRIGHEIAARLAAALGMERIEHGAPRPPEHLLDPYRTEKWAPVGQPARIPEQE